MYISPAIFWFFLGAVTATLAIVVVAGVYNKRRK